MANKWITYIYQSTDYRGGELAVALKIADAANVTDDRCHLKIETIAKAVRLSIRQVKRIIANLETDGLFEIARLRGRGKLPEFRLKKVTSATPFKDRKKVTRKSEKVTSVTLKGDICDAKKVTSVTSPSYKEEPLLNPDKPEEGATASDFGEPENRPPKNSTHWHPVIMALRKVTGRNPDKSAHEFLIKKVRGEIDEGRLERTFGEWSANGNRANNHNGILDWYLGIRKYEPATRTNKVEVGKWNGDESFTEPEACRFCGEQFCLRSHDDERRAEIQKQHEAA